MLNLINSKVTGFIDKSVWLTDIKSQVSSKLMEALTTLALIILTRFCFKGEDLVI